MEAPAQHAGGSADKVAKAQQAEEEAARELQKKRRLEEEAKAEEEAAKRRRENKLAEGGEWQEQLLKQRQEEHDIARMHLQAQEELMVEAGEHEKANQFKEELAEQKGVIDKIKEELAETHRLMEEKQNVEAHRFQELAETKEHKVWQREYELQELKQEYAKLLRERGKLQKSSANQRRVNKPQQQGWRKSLNA